MWTETGKDTNAGATLNGQSSSTGPAPGENHLSLLIIQNGSSRRASLPSRGEVIVGRSDTAGVHLDDPSVSRAHLKLCIGDEVTAEDLGSANGTSIASQKLEAMRPRKIGPGTSIEIGGTVLVLQGRLASDGATGPVASHGYFSMRLEESCIASAETNTPFSIVRFSVRGAPDDAIVAAIEGILKPQMLLAQEGPGHFELLLQGFGAIDASNFLQALRRSLQSDTATLSTGLATFPQDGRSPDALISVSAPTNPDELGATDTGDLVVEDPQMLRLHGLVDRVSAGDISVLLLGETGVGKEVIAESLHRKSPRADRPYVKVNCAALTETLVESELFGHEQGAFTGAVKSKPGLLETADGGTVFLDEIGELPLSTQAKLLRVIEQREVTRVGGLTPRPIDVRFIAATNRDLESECERGNFRRDLYYRLNGVTIVVPPLRERPREIESLARRFVREFARSQYDSGTGDLTLKALERLQSWRWPGNIRELRNVIQRAVLLSGGPLIDVDHLPLDTSGSQRPQYRADDVLVPEQGTSPEWEKRRSQIIMSLEQCSGNQTRAAKLLGVSRRTLVSWMVRFRIPRPHKPLPGPKEGEAIVVAQGEDPALEAWHEERRRVMSALERCSGNQTRAAQMLGMSRRTLVSRMISHRIPRPRKPLPG